MLRPAKHLWCIESKQTLTFQMVKFSITVKQIPGTQARLPENPTDHGQKPLRLCGKQQQRPGLQNLILQLSQPWSCLSLYIQLFASFMLPLLTAVQPETGTPWGMHLWSRAGREGWWHILSRLTPSSDTGPRWTDEPGILSACLCKLTDGAGLSTGGGGKCIECIEISDIHWGAGMFHGIQIRPYTEVYKTKAPK